MARHLPSDEMKTTILAYTDLCHPKPVELASGNFGVTYRATLRSRIQPPVKVACKVSKVELGKSEWHELQILNNLKNHPHVVKLFGVCLDWEDDKVAMVMEFHLGGSLDTHIGRFHRDLSSDRLVHMAFLMASAVCHIHDNGVLHRDIALRNFVVSNEGLPVLVDFGMSRKRPEYLYMSGHRAIPWRWTALEVLGGGPQVRFQPASDVYSLGIAFWELFHGATTPFGHIPEPLQLLQLLISTGDGTSPLQFSHDVPHAVRDLILRMCTARVDDRPTAREVRDTLFGLLHSCFRFRARRLMTSRENCDNQSADGFSNVQVAYSATLDDSDASSEFHHDDEKTSDFMMSLPSELSVSRSYSFQNTSEPSLSEQSLELLTALAPGGFKEPRSVTRTLRSHDIDLRLLAELTNDELCEIFPSSLGTRKRILDIASDMRAGDGDNHQTEAGSIDKGPFWRYGFRSWFSRGDSARVLIPKNCDVDRVLRSAVLDNNAQVVSQILRAKRLKFRKNEALEEHITGATLLHRAVWSGDVELTDCLLSYTGRKLINTSTDGGISPIYIASARGHVDVVERLLNDKYLNKSKVVRSEGENLSYILAAAYFGHLEIIKRAFDGMSSHEVETMLHTVEHIQLFEKIRFSGFDTKLYKKSMFDNLYVKICKVKYEGEWTFMRTSGTPLHLAALMGHIDIVKYFVSTLKVDVNIRDKFRRSVLQCAVDRRHLDIVEYLTAIQGIDVNAFDADKRTPLHLASARGHLDIVRHLCTVDNIALNPRDNAGCTPVYRAGEYGRLDVAKFLTGLDGVNIYIPDFYRCFVVQIAARAGQLAVIKYFISVQPLFATATDIHHQTPLHYAVTPFRLTERHLEVANFLLSLDQTDVNAKDQKGDTALHALAKREAHPYDRMGQTTHLLPKSEQRKSRNVSQEVAICAAISKTLASHDRIDIHLVNKDDKTALELARESKNFGVIDVLIAKELELVKLKQT